MLTWGDPSSPKLFLLHGWMDVGASFQFLVDALERDWFAIAPDLRGFGRSAWQPQGSLEDEIFKRWTESKNVRIRKRRFAELGQHLAVARRIYQQQKDRQGWLFPTLKEEKA